MHSAIQVREEGARGCGWRKVGGLYLMGDSVALACSRLPIPCPVCPCCGRGMKPSRGWTWVDGDELLKAAPECPDFGEDNCEACSVHEFVRHGIGNCGLIWVGETFYPTIQHFNREAEVMGISRRIAAVPNDFVLGETIVMLAHRRAIIGPVEMGAQLEYTPGIFRIFKPTHIEVVVSGEESDETIDGYLKRGLVPVVVKRLEEKQERMLDES